MSSESGVKGIIDSFTKMDLTGDSSSDTVRSNKPSTAGQPSDKPQDAAEEKINRICKQLEAWGNGDERLNWFAR